MRYERAMCANCGTEFERKVRANSQPWCSNSCRMRSLRKDNPPPSVANTLTCRWCGCKWKPRGKHSPLCPTCRESPWRRKLARSEGEKRLGISASQAGFSRLDIFERDNWTCGFCGGQIDRDLEYPDPMSASLDHIIPIPDGPHTRENVRASHLSCNVDHDRDDAGRFVPS